MTEKQSLAESILVLTYGQALEVAGELADMVADRKSRPQLKTAQDFASLLHDWAEANASDSD